MLLSQHRIAPWIIWFLAALAALVCLPRLLGQEPFVRQILERRPSAVVTGITPLPDEPVKQEVIEEKISLVGTLVADEAVEIKNEIAGVIEQVGFEEGQKVAKGQMLFMIDARKLNATLAQAEANMQLAQTTFDRLSCLITAGAISQQEFDQAKSDLEAKKAEVDLIKAQLKETVISASFDGAHALVP